MKPIQNCTGVFVWISIALLAACNTAGNAEKKDTDTTVSVATPDTLSVPAYDPSMDPYLTGGAAIQKLQDTLGVKLYVATLKPGDSAALHNHPDHAVYVLKGGKLALYLNGNPRQEMEFPTGFGLINGPLSDAAKNIGNTTIKMLIADVYRPRGNDTSSRFTYDAAFDPFTVSGSSAKMLKDTLNIKMFEGTLKAGERFPQHAHPDHAMYVLQGGKVAVYSRDFPGAEKGLTMDFIPGGGWVGGPVADSARNIGNTDIKVIEIDFYRPRGK